LIGTAAVIASVVGLVRQVPTFWTADAGFSSPGEETLAWVAQVRSAAAEVERTIDKNVPKKKKYVRTGPGGYWETEVALEGDDRTHYNQLVALKTFAGCLHFDGPPAPAADEFYSRYEATDEQIAAFREALKITPEDVRDGVWRQPIAVPPLWLLDNFLGIPCCAFPLLFMFVGLASWAINGTKWQSENDLKAVGCLVLFMFALGMTGAVLLVTGGWHSPQEPVLILLTVATALSLLMLRAGLNGRFHWNRYIDLIPTVRQWAARTDV
jgi:hypothetical protein